MKKKCCIWTTVIVFIVVVIAAIAVTLGVVLSRGSKDDGSAGESLDDSISQNATFPNGSYTVSVQSLAQGSPGMAPRELNISMLGQLGIRVDNSSLVAETGRLSFFYIWLPPSASSRQIRSPAQEDSNNSDIGNIGIRFGDAHTINVVPLSLASEPLSGLRLLAQLPDSSAVYELQVRMAESMCSGANRGACTVISWRAYSISSDAKTGETGDFSTSLPVACGSQCDSASDSPCATSSCDTCDGQVVAGADTPVTRRYKVGVTSGKLDFQYETYTIKDRVKVTYEGDVRLDSGCVGTQGTRTAPITFTGTSQELRVDVEPNCEGTTGTAWFFQLSCPSPCDNANLRDKGATLMVGTEEIKNGGTAYITKDAQMPALTAYYCSSSGGNGAPVNIQWRLKISPTSGKDDYACKEVNYSGSGSPWNILQQIGANVQGGDATLSWTNDQQNSGSLTFKILGTQPLSNNVIAAITQSTSLWYAKYVAMHESPGLLQFGSDGYPLSSKNGDHGYGIFQLTDPKPNCIQLWSWKENVGKGVSLLEEYNTYAHTFMNGQRQQAKDDNNNIPVPVPDHEEANCKFIEKSARVIEDAVSMKRYNGASLGNYCAWNNAVTNRAGFWKFNPLNNLNINYVNRVCQIVPK